MKKYWKWLAALAAIGAALGLAIVFTCKHFGKFPFKPKSSEKDTEEEDEFDLDSDLKAAEEREYVPLNKVSEESNEI